MKSSIYLILLTLFACGVKHRSVEYGKTTKASLVEVKGEDFDVTFPSKNISIYEYPENEKFQIKNDVVTHGFKDPKGDEKALIFWKHKFKDCVTTTKKIKESKGHEVAEYELKCSSEGLTVIFSEGSEFVSRVVEHEKE
jgi:hypothetical protein